MPAYHRSRTCQSGPPLRHSGPPFVIPAKAGMTNGGRGGGCGAGLVLSLGSGSLAHFARPASRHFHSLIRPSQGHGHSGGGRYPGGEVWVAPNFHPLVCRPLPAWGIVTKTCAGLRSGMTLPALDRDFETHQSPQSSFPRRRESTHQYRAARLQSRNRRQSPQGQCSAWACPPLQAVRQPTLVPSHRKGDPPTAAPNLIHLCAGASRDERLQFLSNH